MGTYVVEDVAQALGGESQVGCLPPDEEVQAYEQQLMLLLHFRVLWHVPAVRQERACCHIIWGVPRDLPVPRLHQIAACRNKLHSDQQEQLLKTI